MCPIDQCHIASDIKYKKTDEESGLVTELLRKFAFHPPISFYPCIDWTGAIFPTLTNHPKGGDAGGAKTHGETDRNQIVL